MPEPMKELLRRALEKSEELEKLFGFSRICPEAIYEIAKEKLLEEGDTLEVYKREYPINEFRSWITCGEKDDDEIGTDYFILINSKLDKMWYWYCFTHEVGHLALHKGDITFPLAGRNPLFEEQANLFARLCLWPLITLFPDLNDKKRSKGKVFKTVYDELIKYLNTEKPSHPTENNREDFAKKLSKKFLERLEKHLPHIYKAILAGESFSFK